jgi:hypothetical protein
MDREGPQREISQTQYCFPVTSEIVDAVLSRIAQDSDMLSAAELAQMPSELRQLLEERLKERHFDPTAYNMGAASVYAILREQAIARKVVVPLITQDERIEYLADRDVKIDLGAPLEQDVSNLHNQLVAEEPALGRAIDELRKTTTDPTSLRAGAIDVYFSTKLAVNYKILDSRFPFRKTSLR